LYDDERDERIEFADDGEWDESVAGYRPLDLVSHVNDVEVERKRVEGFGYYDPESVPGSATSDATNQDAAELALRRSAHTGKITAVVTFSSTGKANVTDIDRDENGELASERPIPNVPVSPSPRPMIPPYWPRLSRAIRAREPQVHRTTETATSRPRERRSRRRVASGTRASPSDLDPDPPSPRVLAGLTTRVLELLARWGRRG
jgi:hypothetical protein